MKTKMVVVSLGLVLGAVAASAQGPRIKFDSTVYDFGSTSLVQTVTGTFTFQNTGNAVLEVKKPATSCGCTVAGVKPEKLAPGERGELVFTLNLAGMRGHVVKTITVPSNDPATPQVQLTLKADVQAIFEVNPSAVIVGDLPIGGTTNFTLTVKRNDGTNCVISKVERSSETLDVTPVGTMEDPKQVQFQVQVNATGAPRRLMEWVRLSAAGVESPIALVYFHGRLVGDVSVTPEHVFWGIPPGINWPGPAPELLTTRKIEVTVNKPGLQLDVRNVSCNLTNITVEVQPVEPGRRYTLVAKLTTPPPASVNGALSFETNIPSQPHVNVPITVNVLKK